MGIEIVKETWNRVVGYESFYEVSNLGRIRSFNRTTSYVLNGSQASRTRKGRMLSQGKDSNGYLIVALHNNGSRKYRRVHNIVLEAFKGACPEGMEVCHNDGNKANNTINNLRYDTHIENIADIKRYKIA